MDSRLTTVTFRQRPAVNEGMSSLPHDPQIAWLVSRTEEFGREVERDSESIRAVRADLDDVRVSERTPEGDVVWVARRRPRWLRRST